MRDPLILKTFKDLAINGSVDGPEFDRGILSVITQIEQTDSFMPDETLYDSLGLSLNPARLDRFSDGVRYAQIVFKDYRK